MAADLTRVVAIACAWLWALDVHPADAAVATDVPRESRVHQYSAEVAAGLVRVDVRACLDRAASAAPLQLLADPDLVRFARDLRVGGPTSELLMPRVTKPFVPVRFAGNVLIVPSNTGCLRYWVDLDAAAREGSGLRRSAARRGADMKTSADLWLLKPRLRGKDRIDLSVSLPPGIEMSAPWTRAVATTSGDPEDAPWRATVQTGSSAVRTHRYQIERSPETSWGAVVAFGRFRPQLIVLPDGARIEVSVLDGTPSPDVARLGHWVEGIARQVLGVHGRFPVRALQVLLVPLLATEGAGTARTAATQTPMPALLPKTAPARGTPEAVGFGRIIRDGGTAAELQIVQTAALSALRADWTASHEFSHLLLPLLAEPGGWISEGFADYYQNLLMARAGEYTEKEAWRRLIAGFERGRGDGHYTDSLQEVMQRNGENALMRRYWTGAIVALLVDVELRAHNLRKGSASNDRAPSESLDTLLGKLSHCCLPAQASWTREQLFTRLDALAGRKLFVGVHEVWEETSAYPDYQDVLRQLGVIGDGRGVRLDNRAPLASVRRAIMRQRGSVQ